MKTVIVSGSRNPAGQTAKAADAVLAGLRSRGGDGEVLFLPTMRIERCRQCDDNGWGLCRKEGRCVIEDDFAALVDKLRAADAAVFATPVYFADLSESLKAFLDRLRRIARNDAGKARLAGKPAIGVCVAGGGGGGAPQCCLNLDRTLTTIGLDVVDVVPARRQNLAMKLEVLKAVGQWLATRPSSQG